MGNWMHSVVYPTHVVTLQGEYSHYLSLEPNLAK